MADPIARYNYAGYRINVYNNRLEFIPPGGIFAKKEMIIFRNIVSIEEPPLLAALDIKTSDGKKHRLPVSLGDKKKLKEQLESLL